MIDGDNTINTHIIDRQLNEKTIKNLQKIYYFLYCSNINVIYQTLLFKNFLYIKGMILGEAYVVINQ